MSYTVELSKSAAKFLMGLNKRDYQLIIKNLLELEQNPYLNTDGKLKGYERAFKKRAGSYRIIYSIEDHVLIVHVVSIGSRKNVYE